ncbi:hypothetical protein STCU_02551 [Strigomonas culicis]|uniref:Uncharacterized protein n=1 Tax=Strigomonas culicis TaxID=28005 RepID=S9WAG5_9TRYP|nr:hypothetical protein STCU_02551 [Strigomonas culicis]|eukprot:EPY32975.1 hypothetical protein STCU_02551 [Strigomonas culicis]
MNPQGFGSMMGMGGYGAPGAPGGGMSSMYGMGGMGSMNNMGSMYSNSGMGGMGSMYGGNMYRPMGSMYGMGGMGQADPVSVAAQWGSLANMSLNPNMPANGQRSSISGGGGFASNAQITIDDLCPNIGSYDEGDEVKRSGRRGGNHLYLREKTAPVVATSNSQSNAITIKRKKDTAEPAAAGAGARSGSETRTSDGKQRAKVPSNYDVHTLLVVEQDRGSFVKVTTPNTVVYEKGGKKETFECDEALDHSGPTEELDSVLLSELRGNWFNGHNSSLLVAAGSGKADASIEAVRGFLRKCVERLEKNEKDASTKFDISINMAALKGPENGKDLLGPGDYTRLKLGSSPVFGPCLLDLKTKVAKTTSECLSIFNEGVAAAKEKKEPICAFLVLKQVKKGGSEAEVYLSSLCLALFREEVGMLVDIKDKTSSSPHRLFRYALGGPSVCVSAVCISNNDEGARSGLEAERKIREVKNRPPRSGNIKRFIEFTEKEISRQKEKLSSVSDSEKQQREAQIARMDEMIKEAQTMLDNPMNTTPKGYSVGM